MHALVIGGTGPTGPAVIAQLTDRGYDVTILHSGLHEPEGVAIVEKVEHIHADPHFREPLEAAVAGREFDLVVAMYGRMTLNVEVFARRCARFVSVGGNPAHRGYLNRRTNFPEGVAVLAAEDAPTTVDDATSRDRFAAKVRAAELAVLQAHADGAFVATHVRYPMIIGLRAKLAFERWAVRRLLAGARRLPLIDGGLSIFSRAAAANAAHCLGLVVDRPDVAGGQLYHCVDDQQYSLAQWTQLIAAALGRDVEIVSVPWSLSPPLWPTLPTGPLASRHTLVSNAKSRTELGYRDVVDPADALRRLVAELAERPDLLADDTDDPAAEQAVLDALDRARDALAAQLGWDGNEEPTPQWHPYAHPKSPG